MLFSPQQKQSDLVKMVTDKDLAFLYEDKLAEFDLLALTKPAVIQSYEIDRTSVSEEEGKISLALLVNRSADLKLNVTLEKDKDGDLALTSAQASKALKKRLQQEDYSKALEKLRQRAEAIVSRDKWDAAVKTAYYERVRDKMKQSSLQDLPAKMAELDQESQEIGSPLYTAFFIQSDLTGREKLALVLDHMKAEIDQHHFLQMKGGYKFSKSLKPTSDFYSFFRREIIESYTGKEGLKADELGEKLHLFRSHIDKQAIDYIRENYQGKTDFDKLLAYTREEKVKVDYTTGAVFHNRTMTEFGYTQNMKVQVPQANVSGDYGVNNARFIEFIVNIESGKFVSEWNVYRQLEDGSYDSDPDHYAVEEGGDAANTESANYGLSKGLNSDVPAYLARTHSYLDVSHPPDTDIRRKMTKKWRPAVLLNKGGRYADIVKKGGYSDFERWREIEDDDRLEAYNDYIASADVGDGFDRFYQQSNQPQSN
ncbi:DUF1310 family protein [Streptococcus panodentis]|uniref:DUF1310 family protein n=1 Tax=Streptococcus panodentis TaxID=1581472 RepID=UPI003B84B272